MSNSKRLRFNKGKRIDIVLLNRQTYSGIIGKVKEIEIKIEDHKRLVDYFVIKNQRWSKIIKVDDIEGLNIYGEIK